MQYSSAVTVEADFPRREEFSAMEVSLNNLPSKRDVSGPVVLLKRALLPGTGVFRPACFSGDLGGRPVSRIVSRTQSAGESRPGAAVTALVLLTVEVPQGEQNLVWPVDMAGDCGGAELVPASAGTAC